MNGISLIFRVCLCWAIAHLTPASAEEVAGSPGVIQGSFLLASAEGVSVFDRDGAMQFGHFSTMLNTASSGCNGSAR